MQLSSINMILSIVCLMLTSTLATASPIAAADFLDANSFNATAHRISVLEQEALSSLRARDDPAVFTIHLEDDVQDFIGCVPEPADVGRCTVSFVEHSTWDGIAGLYIYDHWCNKIGVNTHVSRATLGSKVGEIVGDDRGYSMPSELKYLLVIYIDQSFNENTNGGRGVHTKYSGYDKYPFYKMDYYNGYVHKASIASHISIGNGKEQNYFVMRLPFNCR
ncbi:hypothetical protein ONS95_008420 [Cadophora gregata]|uniref:uncharacterized protein n=1 Tax=Cadophora gregata TaxID=51156 RepID=UPI0026DCFD5D|nr:uncharacterized protein ONS95_008420 [Cadophora gregata]KAK0126841.1 hypothetical protein ONS95_008420 [Cadophora gregata]